MRTRTFLLALLLFMLLPPATAPAQKGALGLGANPYEGVASTDGESRYVTINLGDQTVVEKIEVGSGRIDRLHFYSGALAIPAVAWDGTPAGLSFDGRTLVLPEPGWRFPQSKSRFRVLNAQSLRQQDLVELDGTWTFDALSPDGRWLYLIEYTSPRDITEYAVRAYDLRQGRLDPEPVIDPDEPGEEMYGSPMTRATSVDGRWAYTLYQSVEHHHPPFIHALDTAGRTAACIDLDALAGFKRLDRLELEQSADGRTLSVVDGETPVVEVDLETFEAGEPSAVEAEPTNEVSEGGGLSIAIVAAVAAALVAAAGMLVQRRRQARAR